jgi:hypothetical protein
VFFTPGQDYAEFDLAITASNPSVTEVTEVLQQDIILTCGPALVQFTSGAVFNKAMLAGDSFGDSQMRPFFGVFTWPAIANPMELVSSAGMVTGGVGFVDLDWKPIIGPLGAAIPPTVWDANAYVHQSYTSAMDILRSWDNNWPLGISKNSADSGDQEDQGYGGKGTAAFTGGSFGAAQLLRLVALEWGKRPCNYLEEDGSYLRLDRDLAIWFGRPIFWSPDQLGKPRQPTVPECKGWAGPDNQHCFANTVFAAWQLTGKPSLQRIIHRPIYLRIAKNSWSIISYRNGNF